MLVWSDLAPQPGGDVMLVFVDLEESSSDDALVELRADDALVELRADDALVESRADDA